MDGIIAPMVNVGVDRNINKGTVMALYILNNKYYHYMCLSHKSNRYVSLMYTYQDSRIIVFDTTITIIFSDIPIITSITCWLTGTVCNNVLLFGYINENSSIMLLLNINGGSLNNCTVEQC
ncbi:unnamed protein product [Cunninghamella echinulata]